MQKVVFKKQLFLTRFEGFYNGVLFCGYVFVAKIDVVDRNNSLTEHKKNSH